MLGIKRKINETKFRWNLRKALAEETREALQITLEEVKREIDKRRKNKNLWAH